MKSLLVGKHVCPYPGPRRAVRLFVAVPGVTKQKRKSPAVVVSFLDCLPPRFRPKTATCPRLLVARVRFQASEAVPRHAPASLVNGVSLRAFKILCFDFFLVFIVAGSWIGDGLKSECWL